MLIYVDRFLRADEAESGVIFLSHFSSSKQLEIDPCEVKPYRRELGMMTNNASPIIPSPDVLAAFE